MSDGVSSLGAQAINAGSRYLGNTFRSEMRDGKDRLTFYSPKGYDSVIVYAAKRTMMQLAFAKLNDLYPAYLRKLSVKTLEAAYRQNQGSQMVKIIGGNEQADENAMTAQKVRVSYMGKPAPEALVLWVQENDSVTLQKIENVKTYWDKIKGLSDGRSWSNTDSGDYGDTVFHTVIEVPATEDKVFWDLGPIVQAQSANNVVMTRVQGRDWSRKEFISGGDVNFTVTGKIVSNYPDVYPYTDVSKFVTLMQTKGVLHVSNIMFRQFNISQIIVKDFQLGQNEGFKNVQPYTFTCVGVEPNEAVSVVKDTIQVTNLSISSTSQKGWTTQLLDQVKSTVVTQTNSLMQQLTANVI